MNEDEIRAMFTLAGIEIRNLWKLPNGYLGNLEPLTDAQIDRDKPGQRGFVSIDDVANVSEGVVKSWMGDYRWRHERPAWLVQTPYGLVQITERKRVVDIHWSDTPVRAIVTQDSTTKSETGVHAWCGEKMLEYLNLWGQLAKDQAADVAPGKDWKIAELTASLKVISDEDVQVTRGISPSEYARRMLIQLSVLK